MKQQIETLYLDYFNNFLTIPCFAEYYNLTMNQAERVINIGRKLNHRKSK